MPSRWSKVLKRNEALQLLETALPTLAPHWQAEAMSHIARMYKRLGKADEALRSFEQSMDLHLQTGGLSHYVKDGTAAVHTLIMDAGMQLNEARDLAASLRGILPQHYESQHFIIGRPCLEPTRQMRTRTRFTMV